MHFLGLAGMPRRIPDYPDAYKGWNSIATTGSMISLMSTLLFFYIVYDMFNRQIRITRRNPWRTVRPRRFVERPRMLLLTANSFLVTSFSIGAPADWQMTFQRPATNIMVELIELHHDIMAVLIVIICFVGYFLLTVIEFYEMSDQTRNIIRVSFSHHAMLEKI